MSIFAPTPENIEKAARLIQQGGLVAFPTETVYGLGADAFQARAVARVFEVKNRPHFDPLIVHLGRLEDLERVCICKNEKARALIKHFWPGPLTLVLPKQKEIPGIVTSGLNTVAVRMPSHPAAQKFLQETRTAVAAPSANPFSYLSPTTAQHVEDQIGKQIDMILDGGSCDIGVESTVLDLSETEPLLLRPGGLPLEEIEKVIGKIQLKTTSLQPHSPGQLLHHYAPRTPIKLLEKESFSSVSGRAGLLAFSQRPKEGSFQKIEVLSSRGDLQEAAANLFACLHRLDEAGLDMIYAEAVPDTGLGRAIMDRLRKAQGLHS
jgi:L-threonylcarbamoyladenylate synthase